MDPNETLRRYWDARENGDSYEDIADYHDNLLEWIRRGGFEPDWAKSGHTKTEFMAASHRGKKTRRAREVVRAPKKYDQFTQAYMDAALWSSTDDDGEPLDKEYSVSDISDHTKVRMIQDCADFQDRYADLLNDSGLDSDKAGHDFWLSRNGHGAGFFDERLPGDLADKLQKAAKEYGGVDLYVGDDGEIHGYGGGHEANERRGVVRDHKQHLYVWQISLMVTSPERPGLRHQTQYRVQAPSGDKNAAIEQAKQIATRDGKTVIEVVGVARGYKLKEEAGGSLRSNRVHSSRVAMPKLDGDYAVQQLYSDGSMVGGGSSEEWYDDEKEAIQKARKTSKASWFEGDYTRVLTRDGEVVWSSRDPGGMRETREQRERMYNVVVINERTGKKTYANSSPMTHHEAITFKKKMPPHRDTRFQLEPAENAFMHPDAPGIRETGHRGTNERVVKSHFGRRHSTPKQYVNPRYRNEGYLDNLDEYKSESVLTPKAQGMAQRLLGNEWRNMKPSSVLLSLGVVENATGARRHNKVHDYEVIDRNDRRIAGPFKTRGEANPGPGDVVRFVPSGRRISEKVPNLERHSGSWIATSPTGEVVEFFDKKNAEKALLKGWKVETAAVYLGRINAGIKARAASEPVRSAHQSPVARSSRKRKAPAKRNRK